MKNRKILMLLVLVLLSLTFALSCSSKEKAMPPAGTGTDAEKSLGGAPSTTEALAPEAAPSPTTDEMTRTPAAPAPSESMEQKIIKTADISIEVKNFETSLTEVRKIVKEVAPTDNDGYIANSSSSKSDSGALTGTVVIRIVPGKFDLLIEKLTALGDVKSQQITGEDITKEYYDLKGSLTVKEKTEERLLQLLATRTNNVADLLEVERELGRVREEINGIEGTLRYYDNLVGKSTINLTLYEPEPIVSGAGVIWGPVKDALRNSLEVFSKSVAVLIVFVMGALPWIVVGIIIYFIVRAIVRKRRIKKQQEAASSAKPKTK